MKCICIFCSYLQSHLLDTKPKDGKKEEGEEEGRGRHLLPVKLVGYVSNQKHQNDQKHISSSDVYICINIYLFVYCTYTNMAIDAKTL